MLASSVAMNAGKGIEFLEIAEYRTAKGGATETRERWLLRGDAGSGECARLLEDDGCIHQVKIRNKNEWFMTFRHGAEWHRGEIGPLGETFTSRAPLLFRSREAKARLSFL